MTLRASTLVIIASVVAGFPLLAAPDPSSLVGADVGNPSSPGITVVNASTLTLSAGGRGIGLRSDQFHFASVPVPGDFDIRVRVERLAQTDLWAKAGLMLRSGPGPDATFAAVFATPSDAGCFFQTRTTTGGSATNLGAFPANQPLTWLRLQRSGNEIAGYAGYDGMHWQWLGSRNLALDASPSLGLAVTSHSTNQSTTAVFRDFGDAADPIIARPPVPLEPPGPSNRRTAITLSEIMYHPPDRTDGRDLEFLELHNTQPYFEDISGWRLTGDVDFVFPPGTTLPGGAYLVVAADPTALKAVHGLSNVAGPYTGHLDNQGGRIRLVGDHGAIFQDVFFGETGPWPVTADGAGHSLVLSRPSYGESDPRAWSASRIKGGSPGQLDAVEFPPAWGLRINECRWPLEDSPGFVELFNASPDPAPLDGIRIGFAPGSLPYRFANGTVLAPGAFTAFSWSDLGLQPSPTGETVFLESSDRSRFLDAASFGPQQPGSSAGRWPNGAPLARALPQQPTPGAANSRPLLIVAFSELHPSPLSGDSNEEFVELRNPGANELILDGWRLEGGITFSFPAGSQLSPGGYLAIARNAARLRQLHPGLSPSILLGDFQGRLSSRGEDIYLTRPITLRLPSGKLSTVHVTAAHARVVAGSRWAPESDGGGSTLELHDPRADATLDPNWSPSDETTRSGWTTVEFRGVLDHGASSIRPDSLHIFLMGEGECLVDNVEVIGPGNTNRIANATFESGTAGWTFSGNHVRSSLETTQGDASGQSLHVRASGNGDTGANKIFAKLSSTLRAGETATLRARVKWLRGWPEILLRLHGNYLEAYGRLDAPSGPGTPGARSPRTPGPIGPAIANVTHSPAVPSIDEPVTVSARVDDPDGIRSVTLRYRTDPSPSTATLPLLDDGTGGDLVPNDGIYSAQLPAPHAVRLVAFSIEAIDASAGGATSVFPPEAPRREALVRFGDPILSGAFGTYRMWVSQANADIWRPRPMLSNEPVDTTFVYGNSRVVYNAGSRFAGSPFHQQFASGPLSDAHFVVELPKEERVIGTVAFNKIHAPGNSPFDDTLIQREQVVQWLARKSGNPWLHRRFVHLVTNGARKRTLMEDTQVGSDDLVEEFWSEDPDGDLFKLQPWFEFADTTSQTMPMQATTFLSFNRFLTSDNQFKTARYRPNWLVRGADGTANHFTNVFAIITAGTDLASPSFEANLEHLVDIDAWFRTFAVNHAVGNWDSVGYRNGQNTYAYKPRNGRWELIIWDANLVLGNGSDGPTGLPLFAASDNTLSRWFTSPGFRRRFRSAYYELANGPMQAAGIAALVDSKYEAFQEHGVAAGSPAGIKSFIGSARANILSQLSRDTAPFAVTLVETTPALLLEGTGPLDMVSLTLDGIPVPITWTSTKTWSARFSPASPLWRTRLAALDRFGRPIAGTPLDLRIAPPSSLTLQRSESELVFSYPATHPGTFQLQSSTSLSNPSWSVVRSVSADTGTLQFRLPAFTSESLFFRIAEL